MARGWIDLRNEPVPKFADGKADLLHGIALPERDSVFFNPGRFCRLREFEQLLLGSFLQLIARDRVGDNVFFLVKGGVGLEAEATGVAAFDVDQMFFIL